MCSQIFSKKYVKPEFAWVIGVCLANFASARIGVVTRKIHSSVRKPSVNMFLPRPATGRTMVVVTALFAVVALVRAAPCTPTTCPPGPVVANFDSIDCSGAPTFQPVTHGGSPIVFEECISTSPYNSIFYYETQTAYGMMSLNHPTCTVGLANQSSIDDISIYGVCNPNARFTTSTILLRDVNATYTSPQTFQPNSNVIRDYFESRVETDGPSEQLHLHGTPSKHMDHQKLARLHHSPAVDWYLQHFIRRYLLSSSRARLPKFPMPG